ncbi:MAG: retroviral-like aspartic protease family protein [Muribaculaceae bacterium]
MRIIIRYIALMLAAIILASCGGKTKSAAFYDNDAETDIDSITESSRDYHQVSEENIVSVPFREDNGIKYVNVSVNGFGFEMIFDTGCSGTVISFAEANYLYQKGFLSQDDIIGLRKTQIADGSIVENTVVNLKEVIIDDKIPCPNVVATVSANNNAPLLLGNEVLDRVAEYAVDNVNKTINFKLR